MAECCDALFVWARRVWACEDVHEKVQGVFCLHHACRDELLDVAPLHEALALQPGRPARPECLAPKNMPRRRLGSLAGRQAMLHAVAHIEFNAINLALDALCRFEDMPVEFARDWLQVAYEEAYHFSLIEARLHAVGAAYGDFPAHGGLWEVAELSAGDVLQRMILVPCLLEARGLDVTPNIQERLRAAGDTATARALDVIRRDEIDHVRKGLKWFSYLCQQRTLNEVETFRTTVADFLPKAVQAPFDEDARREAGFSPQLLACLYDLAASRNEHSAI